MVGGILLRAGGEAFIDTWPGLLGAALLGGALEIVAVLAFAAVLIRTARLHGRLAGGVRVLYCLCPLLVRGAGNHQHDPLYRTGDSPHGRGLARRIALWQAPLRSANTTGFALL